MGSEPLPRRKVFSGRDLKQQVGRIVRGLKQGDEVVIEGTLAEAQELYGLVWKRREELVRQAPGRGATGREWEKSRRAVIDRLLFSPPEELRDLIGERLAPLGAVLEAYKATEQGFPLQALGGAVLASPPPVFPPRSQETYALVREALEGCRSDLPPDPSVLDLGCGSGVNALLAATVLGERARILATDILPLALRTTALNASRLGLRCIEVTDGGDLFEPVAGRRFDLIMFNPPWARGAVRSPSETAINDPDQRLLGRFISDARAHMAPRGRVLLVYGATSGSKAIEQLESRLAGANFVVARRYSRRVKTHRKRRSWEAIVVYDLRQAGGTGVVEHFYLTADHNDLQLSPDGKKLLTRRFVDANDEETWWLFDLVSGTVTQLPIPGKKGVVDAFWSGDSRFVSYLAMGDVGAGTESHVVLLNLDGTEFSASATTAVPSHGPLGHRGRMAWMPGKAVLAFIGRTTPTKTRLLLHNVDTGAEPVVAADVLLDLLRPNPSGKTIAVRSSAEAGRIDLVDVAGGGISKICRLTDRVFEMLWSPDGSKLAVFHGESGMGAMKADIYDVGGSVVASAGEVGQWNSSYVPNAAWAPDGSAVYCLTGGFMLKNICRIDAATGAVTTVYTATASQQLHCLAVTP